MGYKWVKASLSLPDEVNQVLDTIDSGLSGVIELLNTILGFLDILKSFIISFDNPLKMVLEQLIESIKELRDSLLGTGFYVLVIDPAGDLWSSSAYQIIESLKSIDEENYEYSPQIPALPGGVSKFLWTIQEALGDEYDPNRPILTDNMETAVMMFVQDVDLSAIATLVKFFQDMSNLIKDLKFSVIGPPSKFWSETKEDGKIHLFWEDKDSVAPVMPFYIYRSEIQGGDYVMEPDTEGQEVNPKVESTLRPKKDDNGKIIRVYKQVHTENPPVDWNFEDVQSLDFTLLEYEWIDESAEENKPYYYVMSKGELYKDNTSYEERKGVKSKEVRGLAGDPEYYLAEKAGATDKTLVLNTVNGISEGDYLRLDGNELVKVGYEDGFWKTMGKTTTDLYNDFYENSFKESVDRLVTTYGSESMTDEQMNEITITADQEATAAATAEVMTAGDLVEVINTKTKTIRVVRGVGFLRGSFVNGVGLEWPVGTYISVFPSEKGIAQEPNFRRFTVEDIFPLRPFFNDLLALVSGLLDSQVGIEDSFVRYLETLQSKIEQLSDIIATLKQLIDDIKSLLDISSVSVLTIDPGSGGESGLMDRINTAFDDSLAPNSGPGGFTGGVMLLMAGPQGSVSVAYDLLNSFIKED